MFNSNKQVYLCQWNH